MKQLAEDDFDDAIVQRDAGSVGERQQVSRTRTSHSIHYSSKLNQTQRQLGYQMPM